MRKAPLCWRRLVAALAFALAPAAVAPAQTGPAGVLLARPQADPALADMAAGFDVWLQKRLAQAGLAASAAEPGSAGGAQGAAAVRALRDAARGRGAATMVVPELRLADGTFALRLAVYAVETGALLAAPVASGPLGEPGPVCERASRVLLERLGIPPEAMPAPATPLLDELAASGRAVRLLEAGELARAWREVEGKLSPTAMSLREGIVARGSQPETPLLERASVLAAMGDAAGAWGLVAPELARLEQQGAEPDARLLLAGVQAQLARGDLRGARPLLDALLARRPDDPQVQLELGRFLTLQDDREGARAALARSAELDPSSPVPANLLAELAADDPPRAAEHLLAAGRREAARLNPQRAERYFERAIQLDPAAERPTLRAIGELNLRIGNTTQALAAFDAAREAGDADAEVLAGLGTAQRRLGQEAAEATLRQALALAPAHPDALRELASHYRTAGRLQQEAAVLEQLVAVTPDAPEPRRALALALQASGEPARALALLPAPDATAAPAAADLEAAARIHRAQGDLPAARAVLLRAVELEPHDAQLQLDLAAVLEAQGDAPASRQARELARLLDDTAAPQAALDPAVAGELDFDALVASFAVQVEDARNRPVALLGIREPADWRLLLLDWISPRRPDLEAITAALERDLRERFVFVKSTPDESPALDAALDRLYAFESESSLSASAIANVISAVGSDAVFVARLVREPPPVPDPDEVAASCADPEHMELEVRMLAGGFTEVPSILVDMECLAGGVAAHGVWNARAFAVYALLLLAAIYPLLRGWGTIVVRIKLPPRTKGFFRIRIGRRPEQARDPEEEKRRRKRAAGRLALSLSSFSRYVKHMAGRETVFRWIPARKREYVVTVRGPLEDALSGEVIGHFLEEQRVRVVRGRTAPLDYDFCPEECAVEIVAMRDAAPARGARVAVRGDAKSLRYAREGSAFVYLKPGRHTLLVGHEDRACERELEIDPAKKALRLPVELGDEPALAFRGCAAAVEPFLLGDLASAAGLLEAAGAGTAAAVLRARLHRERGEHQQAADQFAAAGRLEDAAEMHASGSDFRESAALFEQAGNFVRAAETYRAGGDALSAARCFEAAYDFDSALACYDEAGESERVIELLEKSGAYLDAARRAHQHEDADRALRNLQLIERRDPAWGDACVLMAELLAERGEAELAAGKLGEAIAEAGGDDAPAELHERRATLLEQAGQRRQALEAYETLRRRDPARSDVTERIATLRRGLQAETVAGGATSPTRADGGASRYEILGELGRGGMGVVFRARDRRLGREVALKRLPDDLRRNKAALEMFLREAQAAAALNHRNIVTVYDAGEEDGVYFISMELLEGMPVNAILEKRGRLSVQDTARLGIQIAAGLQYAHERRIVHRDIKTANLFFTRERVVKIMDFGLAKTIEEVRRSSTVIGGTPYYMAPEQAVGGAVDHRTDLYAFGVTLFRMVTGEMPFSEGDLAYHHRHTPAPDSREIDAAIPAPLAELLLKLLAKQPAERCQSAAEVAAALQALLPSR